MRDRRRVLACATVILLFSPAAPGADDLPLPTRTGDGFDFEPSLVPAEDPEPARVVKADVERLTLQLSRARQKAATMERLYKRGIIAKVEAERRALEVVRVEADLEKARLQFAQAQVDTLRNPVVVETVDPKLIEEADAAVVAASQSASAAAAKRRQAELAAAELDLHRKRRLLAAGIGTKTHVKRAEEKVASARGGTP